MQRRIKPDGGTGGAGAGPRGEPVDPGDQLHAPPATHHQGRGGEGGTQRRAQNQVPSEEAKLKY